MFDLAQTFYIESGVVDNATTVHITSIDLYFNAKPEAGKSKTNIYKPGVSVYICPLKDEQPDLDKVVQASRARVEWDSINTSGTAATPTKFTFTKPILVTTDRPYAFLLRFDGSDNDFQLWWNRSGDKFINTSTTATVSAGYNNGSFFKITNGNILTKTGDADLKFNVNIAKFSALTKEFKYREKKYEYFKYRASTLTGDLKVGEYVYKNNAAQTGTINVSATSANLIGTGTNFTSLYAAGDYIIISDGTSGNTIIRTITAVANATAITIDELPTFTNTSSSHYKTAVGQVYLFDKKSDHLILTNSNANSTLYFANNDYIKSEDSKKQFQIEAMKDIDVGRVRAQLNVITPGFTSFTNKANFANSTYYTNALNVIDLPATKRQFIDSYPAVLPSKSLTACTVSKSLWSDDYAVEGALTLTTTNQYSSPYLEEDDLDVFVYRYEINNDSTNEELGRGNATTRYISKRVILGNGQDAEDLRVYLTAYIPQSTSIKVYGKFLNGDDYENIESKNWTPLEEVNPTTYVSSSGNKNDVIEKEYRVPYYFTDETVLPGSAQGQLSNNVILTTSNHNATVNATSGSIVRLYQDGAPLNFMASYVTSSNSSSITISDLVTNSSFNTSGLKLSVVSATNKYSAFVNPQNRNVIRYYTNSYAPMDTYKIFLIKIVLLSSEKFRTPLVKDVRAIAVSA